MTTSLNQSPGGRDYNVRRTFGGRPAPEASIGAVILDIDGTLIDSNDAHARAWVSALAEHGFVLPYERVRSQIGVERGRILKSLSGVSPTSPIGMRILERRTEAFLSCHLAEVHVFPNTRLLLERMRDEGLRRIAASRSSIIEVDALLHIAGVDDLVEARPVRRASGVHDGAPLLKSLVMEIGLPPEEVVFIGDTPYDVETGVMAGVHVIALRCGGWGDRALAGATALFDDAADLLRYYDASPLGWRGTPSG